MKKEILKLVLELIGYQGLTHLLNPKDLGIPLPGGKKFYWDKPIDYKLREQASFQLLNLDFMNMVQFISRDMTIDPRVKHNPLVLEYITGIQLCFSHVHHYGMGMGNIEYIRRLSKLITSFDDYEGFEINLVSKLDGHIISRESFKLHLDAIHAMIAVSHTLIDSELLNNAYDVIWVEYVCQYGEYVGLHGGLDIILGHLLTLYHIPGLHNDIQKNYPDILRVILKDNHYLPY